MVSPVRLLSCLGLLSSFTRAATVPNTIELALTSNIANTTGEGYFVNITIGTPGQLQTMVIDTGSANAIVIASNTSFCASSVCDGGTLNSSASSTFETTNHGALKQGTISEIEFIELEIAGRATNTLKRKNEADKFPDDITITNFPMGIANRMGLRFNPHTGILGLGYSSQMTPVSDRWLQDSHEVVLPVLPPSFVEALVQAGAISSRLYSIYLNSLDRSGSIIFGGLDTAKYHGTLTTLNVVALDENKPADDFSLYLDSVTMHPHDEPKQTIVRPTEKEKYRYMTVPDTGSPSWDLPPSAYHKVAEYAGVISTDDLNLSSDFEDSRLVKPCSDLAQGSANTTRFEIVFSGNGTNAGTLNVELADLFTPLTAEDGSAVTDEAGRPMCWLRIVATDSSLLITGSSVMRAGLWVFDLDNGQVSLAQGNLRANSSSNVVQVEAGADGLSKAVKELRAETKKINVEGRMSPTAVYTLSTVTSSVGYSTGLGVRATAKGTTESPRNEPVRP
ncbi:acid protease [Aureobasidium sp. EXF-8845]|nr:acid protease [Aureobasidium sp. EXF-8845]KAI4847849.1 acid protease [Aureobasidium sp. EXF-8846]